MTEETRDGRGRAAGPGASHRMIASGPAPAGAAERAIRCRNCGSPMSEVPPEQRRFFPFCSERCQLVDLGRWFNETYRVPVKPDDHEDEGGGG